MSAPPAVAAEPSPIDAARDAWDHTRRVLFPFRFNLWLGLGAVSFLDQCGRGGVGGAVPGTPPAGVPGDGGGAGLPAGASDLGAWFWSHLGVIVAVAATALVVVVALVAVALWIGSRATFVYADDVVTGRAELSRPWRAHADKAASYFAWRFGLAAVLAIAMSIVVVIVASAILLGARGSSGAATALALSLVVAVPVVFLVLVASGLLAMALRDFVAPLQMHTGLPCGAALRVLGGLVRTWPLPFFLYVVLKLVFGVLQGLVIVLAACATCCLVLVPVVTQAALQPVFFFERAWSLHFLRRMGYDLYTSRNAVAPETLPG